MSRSVSGDDRRPSSLRSESARGAAAPAGRKRMSKLVTYSDVPEGVAKKVVVKEGDNLTFIAARNGVSLQALLATNSRLATNGRRPELVFAGDEVLIPAVSTEWAQPARTKVGARGRTAARAPRTPAAPEGAPAAAATTRAPESAERTTAERARAAEATGGPRRTVALADSTPTQESPAIDANQPAPRAATGNSAEARGASQVEARVRAMTTQQKAKLVVMNYGDVSSPPWSGSIIVNNTHLNASGMPKLEASIAKASARLGSPVLVAADQEGGRVNRLGKVPGLAGVTFPSPEQMQSMTPAQIRAEGEKTGKALRTAGVNMLLGPVLDAASPGTLMDNMGRAFGSTPAEVLKNAQPFIDGVRAANPNVVIIAKHFPGYDSRANSDIAHVEDQSTLAQVRTKAAPFLKAKGLDGVMMTSIRYPRIDDEPACFSPTIISLAREANPDALIITDDVAAPGLMSNRTGSYINYKHAKSSGDAASIERFLRRYPEFDTAAGKQEMEALVFDEIKANAKKAFVAGCDVVLTMDSRAAAGIAQAIAELMVEHPELKPRLDLAAARLLEASMKAGGLSPTAGGRV
jgi:beta-glucosidase-like glycosyl hydrolase